MKHLTRALFATSLLCALFLGCDTTEGRRVRVRFRFVALAEAGYPLGESDTDTGFHVALSEARLALGPLYVLKPKTAVAPRARLHVRLASLFGPSPARAHGGVDPVSGLGIVAQSLEQLGFDALDATPVDTAPSIGSFGEAGSVVLELDPPVGAIAEALHGHHAYVEGVATKDGATIPFAGGIDLADEGTLRRVENIALAGTLDEGGIITIGIRPGLWLAGARFDRLGPADASGIHPIAPGSQVYGALTIGVRSASAYEASYSEETP